MAGRFEFDPEKILAVKAIRDMERMMKPYHAIDKVTAKITGHDAIAKACMIPTGIAKLQSIHEQFELGAAASAVLDTSAMKCMPTKYESIHEQFALKWGRSLALDVAEAASAHAKLFVDSMSIKSLGIDTAMERAFPKTLHSLGICNMETLIGSTALLGRQWAKPSAILSAFPDPSMGGVFTWVEPDDSKVVMASVLPDQDDVQNDAVGINIELRVVCAFCTQPTFVTDRKLSFIGPRTGILDVSIVPICAACQRAANQDPSYYAGMVDRLNAPRLRLLDGSGQSDGVKRGVLRLVEDEDDS